ncbi:right-handed parallel beta-helix repeat-containing protein [Microvirga sp. TS319]|uniref:right-handed parallel beta-helix repeat-containing protein n=1 Tax=Microvirga sp. TS319 TaxID=3241165 RepID=UPI00351A9A7D
MRGIAVVAISLLLCSGSWAQETGEVGRLAEEARQALLAGNQGASSEQRAAFYQTALARVQLLEKFGAQDNSGSPELREGARIELKRLADDGLSHDMLGELLLQALLVDLNEGQSGADRADLGVTLHQVASEQRASEHRALAFIEMGQAYSRIGAQDRALRYATLALEAAKSIPEATEQSKVFNAVSRLAALLGPTGLALAERAVALIPRSQDRAYAHQDLARADLKGTAWQNATREQLAVEARRRLATGDIRGGLHLALAIPEGGEQRALLADLLSAALMHKDIEAAVVVAQSFVSVGEQQKALASVAKASAGRGVPLQSASVLEAMQDGPGKASAHLTVATALARAGYDKMADELFGEALQDAQAMDGADQAVIWPEVVQAFAQAGRLDEALGYAARIEPGTATSSALSELAERLADSGRLADASTLMPRIEEPDDRSRALSGIGRARARTGDIAGAVQISANLTDPEDIGRILSSVVKALSLSGEFEEAAALAGRIEDKQVQVEAWVEIARQAGTWKEAATGEKALGEAIHIAGIQGTRDRGKAYYAIVKSLADLGDRARANELRLRIMDEGFRSQANEALGKLAAKQAVEQKKRTSLPDATLKRALSQPMSDEDKQEIAIDLAGAPNGIVPASGLIRTIEDDRTRNAAFRRLAELQMAALSEPIEEKAGEIAETAEALPQDLAEDSELGPERRTTKGLVLASVENEITTIVRPPVPQGLARASGIRATVPWPSGAVAGITFANYNLYISKFLDEGPSGGTRLEQAARHQGLPNPRIIVVQSGSTTLGMLARQFRGTDEDLIAIEGDVLTLRVPVFVAPGARLILSGLDSPVYRFSADAGAFVAGAGDIEIVDAQIIGYDEEVKRPAWSDKSRVHDFRPFLLCWGDGRMNVAGSVLTALGYENSKSFGLSYSSGPIGVSELRDQAHATGFVVDNVFRNSHFGFYSYEAESIHIIGNEYIDNVIYGLDPHDRTRKLTIALNTTYGTKVKHGIIVSREVDESVIVGNLTFDNVGSGIMLDRGSSNNVVHANSAFNNEQDGITLFESSCNLMTANHLLANKRDGMKVRNSFDIGIYGNRIETNGGAGINAYVANLIETKSGETRDFRTDPYDPVTSMSLRRNLISANGVGINAEGVSGLAMLSNRFVRQSRRLFGGDLRGLEGPILQGAHSSMLIASVCRPVRPLVACRLREQGYFEGGADSHAFDPHARNDCTSVDGTVQQRAFSNASQRT